MLIFLGNICLPNGCGPAVKLRAARSIHHFLSTTSFSELLFLKMSGSFFGVGAKGPNASAEAGFSSEDGARAFAKAGLGSVSAEAGPVKATVGLSADTGIGVGLSGVEAKVLGTGFSFGRTMGVSLFGTGFEFKLW
ncbi:hypothetical protein PFLUV_G00053180 [Perca fluviatilis]|uniref:Uncharacterized protein n=1 Tax=Perca fluviatilis TaxID=8168 RepID=A0A6A5EKY7_PERFL|nr:hypothetical protein PFLUV_G00053180 [Perca fluviatilis]